MRCLDSARETRTIWTPGFILGTVPAQRQISPGESNRLVTLRDEAAARRQAIIDDAPPVTDPLGRVAWHTGLDGNPLYAFNNDLRIAINDAREARFQWREIANALGEDDDSDTANRANAKQMWRNRSHNEHQTGNPDAGID